MGDLFGFDFTKFAQVVFLKERAFLGIGISVVTFSSLGLAALFAFVAHQDRYWAKSLVPAGANLLDVSAGHAVWTHADPFGFACASLPHGFYAVK